MDDYLASLSKPVDLVKSVLPGKMFFNKIGQEVKQASYSTYLISLVVLVIIMSIVYDAIQFKLKEGEKRKP